jgi:small subunit ribosomal protein S2
MAKLPGTLVVIDVHREINAVREARKLGIPTVCLIDTDSDPDFADIPIPGNDDAIRAIDTILVHLGDAVEEGKKGRAAMEQQLGDAAAAGRKRSRRGATRGDDDLAVGAASGEEAPAESLVGSPSKRANPELTPASTAVPDASS